MLQLKWNLPEETGGEDIHTYLVEMQPAPPGWEVPSNAEVGDTQCKQSWTDVDVGHMGRHLQPATLPQSFADVLMQWCTCM